MDFGKRPFPGAFRKFCSSTIRNASVTERARPWGVNRGYAALARVFQIVVSDLRQEIVVNPILGERFRVLAEPQAFQPQLDISAHASSPAPVHYDRLEDPRQSETGRDCRNDRSGFENHFLACPEVGGHDLKRDREILELRDAYHGLELLEEAVDVQKAPPSDVDVDDLDPARQLFASNSFLKVRGVAVSSPMPSRISLAVSPEE